MTAEDRYMDGYLAGCATGNGYMLAVDEELKALRTRVELLGVVANYERQRADRAEAQALTLAEENTELLTTLREQIADAMRLTGAA